MASYGDIVEFVTESSDIVETGDTVIFATDDPDNLTTSESLRFSTEEDTSKITVDGKSPIEITISNGLVLEITRDGETIYEI